MKIKKIVSLLLIMTMVFSTSINVSAKNNTNDFGGFKSESDLINYLKDNGVPSDKQEILSNKLKDGIIWDCYNAEKVKQIPKSFSWFDAPDKIQEKYFRFEDGSFIKVSVGGGKIIKNFNPNHHQSGIGIKSVTLDQFGALYVNRKISKTIGRTNAYFYANFYLARPGFGPSKIYTSKNSNGRYNSPFGEGITGFGVTANPTKDMIREVENTSNSQAALFRLLWFNQVTVSSGWTAFGASIGATAPIGSTCNLYLALINGNLYIDSKLPF